MFDWLGWAIYARAVQNTPWHLIGLFAAAVQSGKYRAAYIDGHMWMLVVKE